MEFVESLLMAAELVLGWQTLAGIVAGIVIGQYMGAIPGLTSSMAIAILIPVTFYLPPWVGITMLLGVYKGALFADSTAAILLRTPGMPAAAAVMLDGYPLAQQGKAGKALKTALYSSVFGDTFSDLVLIVAAGFFASIALSFGAPEYAALIVFALTMLAGIAGRSMLKGLAAACVGLFLATVGSDPTTMVGRMTFGQLALLDGFSLIPFLIGLLAVAEVLRQLERPRSEMDAALIVSAEVRPEDNRVSWKEFRGFFRAMLKGSIIGTVIGAIPGLGATVATFLSYNEARRSSRNPEMFGKGSLEGVAAADSATSATSGANMIPLLAFGIPGDVIAALLLGAFLIHGVSPGPLIFQDNAHVIYAIFMGLLIANFVNLVTGLVFIKVAVQILKVPKHLLFPAIIVLAIVGSYTLNNSMFEVKVMLIFGVVGYLMSRYGYSPIALLIGFILGPLLEANLRRSLILSDGSLMIFLTRPLSLGLLLLAAVSLVGLLRLRRELDSVEDVAATDDA